MSDSLPDEVLGFLRKQGLIGSCETPAAEPLRGGVSSDIWRIERPEGAICVKRALPRLRVAQLWEAPVERNRYEHRWMEIAAAIVPGSAPKVLAAGNGGCFAMQFVAGAPLWKAELAAGRAEPAFAAAVGRSLARIHAATAGRPAIAREFATDAGFHAIRLEPYLLASARAHPDLAGALTELAGRTARTRLALVHGDVSPKNILVGPAGPVFLDAECAWYGDPAFDLAFCLNHLLLKCLWVPGTTRAFLLCFDALFGSYLAGADWEPRAGLEARTASLLPGLMLARVDGKSPVEYLTRPDQKQQARDFAARFLRTAPQTLRELRDAWQES